MTPITVLDTSVAADLHRGGMIDSAFKLPVQFVVPQQMYDHEFEDWFGPSMMERGLLIRNLSETEIEQASEFMRMNRNISLLDAYALAMAACGQHMILAGDKGIRDIAVNNGMDVGGLLHVFDLVEIQRLLAPASLHSCLNIILRSSRARLPLDEVEARMQRYQLSSFPISA